MKKRTIWKMFLLEIVTLGIYRLYFLIKTRNEMMKQDPSIKIKSPLFLLAPIGIMIVAVIILIASLSTADRTQTASTVDCNGFANSQSDSSASSDTFGTPTTPTLQNCSNFNGVSIISILVLYLGIFASLILFVIWEWSYSHGVDKITHNKLGFALTLIILILVPDGIDILIIQDYFNKLQPNPESSNPPIQPVPTSMPPVNTPQPTA